jgi:4-hydroxybenzoate polyprenyltransferase
MSNDDVDVAVVGRTMMTMNDIAAASTRPPRLGPSHYHHGGDGASRDASGGIDYCDCHATCLHGNRNVASSPRRRTPPHHRAVMSTSTTMDPSSFGHGRIIDRRYRVDRYHDESGCRHGRGRRSYTRSTIPHIEVGRGIGQHGGGGDTNDIDGRDEDDGTNSSADDVKLTKYAVDGENDASPSKHGEGIAPSPVRLRDEISNDDDDNAMISRLPSCLRPYARLARIDKPIGTLLLLHPCLWSVSLATSPSAMAACGHAPPYSALSTLSLFALFGTGSFVMRSAGCTINDMWDSKYDRDVERTKTRPLACGELTHLEALSFLGLQLSTGLCVLLSLPHVEECFYWGVASLPLVVTYPLMKRYTNYPQLVLGMTFNWGTIMGWVSVHGFVNWEVVGPLYVSGVAWTMIYDTLYAHQDKMDDAKLGLKSTALTFGEDYTRPILTSCALIAYGGWTLAGYNCGFDDPIGAPYYYAGIAGAAAHLLWQIHTADLNNADNLAYRFRSNNVVGWIVLCSCVAGNVMSG